LARVTKVGGHVIVSDVVWRTKPESPLGDEWRWLAEMEPITAEEYGAAIEAAGVRLVRTEVHDRAVWEDYFRPMLEGAREAQTAQPADIFFADEIESAVGLERRGVEEYIDYATFVAMKA
jgi:hypothetical protein